MHILSDIIFNNYYFKVKKLQHFYKKLQAQKR